MLLTSDSLKGRCPVCGTPNSTCSHTTEDGEVVVGEVASTRVVVDLGGGMEYIVAAGDPIPEGATIVAEQPLTPGAADVALIPENVTLETQQDVAVVNPGFEVFGMSTRQVQPAADGSGRQTYDTGDEAVPSTGDDDGPKLPNAKSSRPELDAYARSLGLNPSDYSNKKTIAAAIADASEEA